MAGTLIVLPLGGSRYWQDASADFASLPASAQVGEVRITLDTLTLYAYNGAAWTTPAGLLAAGAATDTNSIDQTITAGVLTSDVKLSNTVATAGSFKATTTIKAGVGAAQGLHVEVEEASGSQTGVLKSADWTTFNSKEPAITAGTNLQYIRGDKSLAVLDTSIVPENGGVLYFTTARAKGAAVADAINDGTLDVAPSQNAVFDALALKVNTSSVGVAGGVASLDGGGKVPVAQLPNSIMEYQGTWNANTNTPALTDGGAFSTGDVYKVTTAGTTNHGSGNITYVIGDYSIYNGATWEKAHSGADAITSVNGLTGVVSLKIKDIVAITDSSSSAAGEIGEVISNSQTATTANVNTTGLWGSVTSVALTAGVWEITGVVGFQENGAVLTDHVAGGVSTSTTGGTIGSFDYCQHNALISGSADLIVPLPTLLVNLNGAQTYHLNTRFNYTSGTPKHYGKLQARRIR